MGTEGNPVINRQVQHESPAQVLARAEAWGVDLSLLRESLALTPTERLERHRRFSRFISEFTSRSERASEQNVINALLTHGVDFVIVGDLASLPHGFTQITLLVEVAYARTTDNFQRLDNALSPYHPRLRGVPKEVPFRLDARTLQASLNFTLITDLGAMDLLGEVAGFPSYQELVANTETLELYGWPCKILTLEGLIRAKRAAGRGKDLSLLPELERLLTLRQTT